MSRDSQPILVADGIGKSFGSERVLKSASLRGYAGTVVGVLGPNGIGKTTLFRVIVGRVVADYGRVLFGGEFFPRPSLSVLARRGLMYSSQESGLTGLLSVRAHLRTFSNVYSVTPGVESSVVEDMRLEELMDQVPATLSGGEKQRVSLALALMRRPTCLITDEPFAGVAPKDRPLVALALSRLAGGGGAVILSGHDVEDIFAVSDVIFWMAAGTTYELGPPEVAREHHQFRREYLGSRMLR